MSILLTGAALSFIGEACEMARALQPAVVVVEDVDLIAAQRRRRRGLLPPPAAPTCWGRRWRTPGAGDHTARLPLPDAGARRRLLCVYQGNLQFSRSTAAAVVARTTE